MVVDQLIDHLKVKGAKRQSIQRLLISDLNPEAVTQALSQLRDNKEFIPLSTSALARSRADWLYGINMTRASTLQGRKVGYQGVLSVGRVQTPVLGLVVRRDAEIEHFVVKPFYQVVANIETEQGETFKARWQPSEACQPWQDDEGRVLHRPLADNVVARISGQPAVVDRYQKKTKKQPPPLPYNLSSLQIDAAKRFSMSAKQVLDTCQSLYERHKLLTYPRSDSRYIPEQHYQQRTTVLAAIAANAAVLSASVLGQAVGDANPKLKSKAWDDTKVQAHHAIIPTAKTLNSAQLSKAEQQIYGLVARQYVAQFYPAHEYSDSEINLRIAGGVFVAKAREPLLPGWKALFPAAKKSASKSLTVTDKLESALNITLPNVKKNQRCHCLHGEVVDKKTTPPKPFDDASLLAAMTGIARYVEDLSIRKVLKETDGLGTEATRAGIIELLFKRDFLNRQVKQIRSTAAGKALIESLPMVSTTPDMTAQWEMQLNAISLSERSYQQFMVPLEQTLHQLIEHSQAVLPVGLNNITAKKPAYKKSGYKKAGNKKTSTKKTSTKKTITRPADKAASSQRSKRVG